MTPTEFLRRRKIFANDKSDLIIEQMKVYILEKELTENIKIYFKKKDRTGHTNTDSKFDAMTFIDKNEAIDYNYKWLYGDYVVIMVDCC